MIYAILATKIEKKLKRVLFHVFTHHLGRVVEDKLKDWERPSRNTGNPKQVV